MENEETKFDLDRFVKELAKQTIDDPSNARNRRKSKTYKAYTKADIEGYLKAPTANEVRLRDASNYLFQVSTRYRRLLESIAGIPCYAFVISPLNFNPDKLRVESFKKSYQKVSNAVELMCLPDEARKVITVALRDGVFYGVRWKDSTSSFVQQLDPDCCTVTHMSDGTFLFAFDFSKITNEAQLASYPPIFTELYYKYQEDPSPENKYQLIPPDISVCLKADPTTLNFSIPPFAGALPSLFDIDSALEKSDISDEISNYKMIHGQIEVDDKGVPTIDYNDMLKYYKMLCNAVGDKVGVGVSPFKVSDINFEKSGAATEVDMVARAVEHYWSTVGSSAVLHGAGSGAAGVQKLSLKNEESYVLGLLKQYERLVNRYLKTVIGGTTKFKVSFLPITIFNREEIIQEYKSAIHFGLGKSYYAAALSIPMYDVAGLSYIENNIIDYDNILTPMVTATTMDDDGENGQVGRPAMDDTELSEDGESTRETDQNANR